MKKTKWLCEECHTYFKTKRELIDDLKDHFEEARQIADYCSYYLEELGITNPYEE